MPRLGVITDEISEDFDHALAVCDELGIRDIELRSIWGKSIVDHDEAERAGRSSKLIHRGDFRGLLHRLAVPEMPSSTGERR